MEDIYDLRNIEIEKQLINKYQSSDFNYSVRYKNGLHNVYTYHNRISEEYKYYIKGEKIILKK